MASHVWESEGEEKGAPLEEEKIPDIFEPTAQNKLCLVMGDGGLEPTSREQILPIAPVNIEVPTPGTEGIHHPGEILDGPVHRRGRTPGDGGSGVRPKGGSFALFQRESSPLNGSPDATRKDLGFCVNSPE